MTKIKLPRFKSAGYTLTELMLVVAILGIVFGLASAMLIQMTRFYRQNRARIAIQRDARTSLDLINRNLRQAKAGTIVVDQVTGEPPYSRITFDRFTPDGGTATMSFYQQGNTLYMVRGGTKAISKNLRYMGFTYPRTDVDTIISVSLTTETGTYESQTKALQLSVEKVRIMN